MKIKKFKKYTESISGTEMIGSMGPNYGENIGPKTITSADTDVVYSEMLDKIFSKDEYDNLYQEYLTKGGKPLHGFTKQNLDLVLNVLQ